MQPVLETELDGIHLNLPSQLIHYRLNREMALGIGPTPVGAGARAVRPHRENFPLHVGTSVVEIDGARADCKGDILPETTVRPIAVVEKGSNFDRRKRATFFGSCFDIMGQLGAVM